MSALAPLPTSIEASYGCELALAKPLRADQLPALVYLSQIGKSSRRTMRSAIDTVARIMSSNQCDALSLDWSQVRFQHTAAVRSVLAEIYAPATANRLLSALRKTLHAAWFLGYIDAETYQRAVNVKDIKADQLPAGRALSDRELAALTQACALDPTAAGIRDGGMLAVMCAGLRRSEVANLQRHHVELETGAIQVIGGKGRKDRITYLPPGAIEPVQRWLEWRGDEPGPMFYPINRGGRVVVQDRSMNDQSVLVMLDKRVTQAAIAPCSPHDFRRTFITNLLKAGVDVILVQRLAGHSDPTTTARYDQRQEDQKRMAVQKLCFGG